MGITVLTQGQYSKGIEYHRRCLEISRNIGNRRLESMLLNNLGFTAYEQGQYDGAENYSKQSLIIAKKIDNRHLESQVLNNLGSIAYSRGQYKVAEGYFEQSLIIAQESGYQDVEAKVLNNWGALALAKSVFLKAHKYYEQALHIRQGLEQTHLLVEDWAGLALVALHQRDTKMARLYIDQLLPVWLNNLTFKGSEHPMRVFHFTWQVCRELGLAHADDVLLAAVQVMQRYLDNHSDPEMQAVYLRQPDHQSLWKVGNAKENQNP